MSRSKQIVNSAIAGIAGAVIASGIILLGLRVARDGDGAGYTNPYEYDIEQYRSVDPDLIGYVRMFAVDPAVNGAGALAVGDNDDIWIAGDGEVAVANSEGERLSSFRIGGAATCMAVDGGKIIVGVGDRIEIYGTDGEPAGSWESMGENAVLTSIAVDGDSVCVADAGNRTVWLFDKEGRLQKRLDGRDKEKKIPGFIVPSPYFDVAFGPGDVLWTVNPGRQRVQRFAPDGKLVLEWGTASMEIEGFSGCCNPSHIAIAPDGSFITAEKGLPRIKTFTAEGAFRDVVAGADHFGNEAPGCEDKALIADIAVDSSGRVIVLNRKKRLLEVFARKETAAR